MTDKDKAIANLKREIDRLDFECVRDYQWFSQTNDLLRKYIGDSAQLKYYHDRFKPLEHYVKKTDPTVVVYIEEIKRYINGVIQTIEDIGLHKESVKTPFYKRFETYIIAILSLGLPALYYRGQMDGKQEVMLEKIELKHELEKQADDLRYQLKGARDSINTYKQQGVIMP